ncbi:hypothetical protein RND71_010372 [Anisodus tanguticus]|uniref:Uncharacterized protein n=1 Tax=Anisodus tanguticus TaxID=243964 RepID=A0AAE1VJ31_9SOLA|nr:hypothetical protein RND71_010372 [Anisodus tanguticus]
MVGTRTHMKTAQSLNSFPIRAAYTHPPRSPENTMAFEKRWSIILSGNGSNRDHLMSNDLMDLSNVRVLLCDTDAESCRELLFPFHVLWNVCIINTRLTKLILLREQIPI